MAATIETLSLPSIEDGALIVLDCKHGTTRVAYANADNGFRLDRDTAIKMALMRHYGEERCHCIRRLWREHLGSELGEMVLVKGPAR